MKIIIENPQPKIKIEKEQPDSYTIYLGNEEIGYAYCNSYYSKPQNRLWDVVIELYGWKESGKANSVKNIKEVASELYNLITDRNNRWNSIYEDIEYTDIIDVVKETLKKEFPELIVSIVNKPRRAVRVESEKVLDDGNTLFNETFYIFEGSDGRIKAVREHDRPVVFVDVDGVINFFNDYLNS